MWAKSFLKGILFSPEFLLTCCSVSLCIPSLSTAYRHVPPAGDELLITAERMATFAWQAAAMLLLCWYKFPLAASTPGFDAVQLKTCYQQRDVKTLSFEEYMTGLPSRLHLHSVLQDASATAKAEQNSVLSVVTAFNAARLDSLSAQCQSWPGLIVAALYYPVIRIPGSHLGSAGLTSQEIAGLKDLETHAQRTMNEVQKAPDSCALRILILYEYVDSPFMAALIPINALRNAALLGATTPLVAMVDVDLLISSNLGNELVNGDAQLKTSRTETMLRKCQQGRSALILPAFQTPKNRSINGYPSGEELIRSIQLVQNLVKGNKTGLHQALRNGDIIKFASQQFSVGHRRTDFPRWFDTTTWYQVEFVPQFEPWYIVDRLHTPFYDVNFRGYGRNKQQQAAHASSVGMNFWVHPDAFLIHMPHEKSEAQKDHDATWIDVKARQAGLLGRRQSRQSHTAGVGHRQLTADGEGETGQPSISQGLQHVRRVDKLFRQFVRKMAPQEYKALLDPAAMACLGSLPWWNGSSIMAWSTTEPNQ